jgi:hypothetical protein
MGLNIGLDGQKPAVAFLRSIRLKNVDIQGSHVVWPVFHGANNRKAILAKEY